MNGMRRLMIMCEAVFYHGTSTESAEYLAKHGFGTAKRGRGMGSGIDPFTFLTPSKAAAQWYASENFRNKDRGKILRVAYPASVYQTSNRQKNALQAFAEAGDDFSVPKPNPTRDIFDSDLIARVLLDNGYNAIAFRDRDSGGRSAIIALRPELIEVIQ